MFHITEQVKAYMGEGWHSDFGEFDICSRPDFYLRVRLQEVFITKHQCSSCCDSLIVECVFSSGLIVL